MKRLLLLLAAVALVAACDKTEPAPTPAASAAPPATAPREIGPLPATVSARPPESAPPPATSGSAAAVDCGGKTNPCPLQGWMRENVNPPMNKNDMPGLAEALDKIAGFAPPGYTNWASISRDGAAAARSGDSNAAKASCRECHNQYKEKYKNELRGRKI